MSLIPEPLKQWFGFTRRERRSSLILLMLIAIVYAARYLFPDKAISIEELSMSGEFANLQETIRSAGTGPVAITGTAAKAAANDSSRGKHGSYVQYGNSGEYRGRKPAQAKVELNLADSALLESLPGLGPVLAARTVKYRELLGGFFSVEQLREVYGLSSEIYDIVSSRLTVDSIYVRKIDVNKATYAELLRHPYIERYDVSAILRYRETIGELKGMGDIAANRLVDSSRLKKISPYLKFR